MAERKKILWLASWYPNRTDRFDGDFIQRLAQAASLHHDVHVLYLTAAEQAEPVEEERREQAGLTEQILYFRKGRGVLEPLRRQMAWRRLARKAVREYVAVSGRPHAVHVQVAWKSGLIALWMKRKWKIPYLVTEHWGMFDPALPGSFAQKPRAMRHLLRRIFREAAQCVPVSRFLAAAVERATGRKADSVLPNVVDTELFRPGKSRAGAFTFLHVSNMAPVKGVDGILEAFQALLRETGRTDLRLVLVGNRDGEYPDRARRLGLPGEQVVFRGEVPYAAVAAEMKKAHCLVLNSRSETFSCVTAEALCTGLPVIAPRVGALPELIHSGNGRLMPDREVATLVATLKAVLGEYEQFRTDAIAAEAAARFGYPAVALKLKELYEGIGSGAGLSTRD